MSTASPDDTLLARLGQSVAMLSRGELTVANALGVATLTVAAARWVTVERARELSRNLVQALSFGEPLTCIREAIEHRRTKLALEVSEEEVEPMAEAMAEAWKQVTV